MATVTERTEINIKYIGSDWWCRPLFQDYCGRYFCSTDILYTSNEWSDLDDAEKSRVINNLDYMGRDPENDPIGKVPKIKFILVDSLESEK